MNKVTYLIFVILFVYGISEIVSHNISQSKNDNKTNNSIKIINPSVNESKFDAFVPSTEGSPSFVKNSSNSETLKPNSSKIFFQILKRSDNLISSETKNVGLTFLSRSSSLSPSLSTKPPTSKNGTTINNELTPREKFGPKTEETTKEIFASSASTANISVSPTNVPDVKSTEKRKGTSTKIFISSEAGIAEATTKIFVPSDSEVAETIRRLSSESTAITSSSPINMPKVKTTTKRKKGTTNTPIFSEEGVVKITKELPSESTETTTLPPNISNTDTISSLMATTKQIFPTSVSTQTVSTATQKLVSRKSRQYLTFSEAGNISCTYENCKMLSKEYLESHKPALCNIGHYGSRCYRSCINCLGKLCLANGHCFLGKLPFCDIHGCRQGLGLVNTFQLQEIPKYIEVVYKGPTIYNTKLIYWTYKPSKLESGEEKIITSNSTLLPIKYSSKFIVCLLLFLGNIFHDVECQTIDVNYRCIGLKNVKFWDDLVVWDTKNRVDLFHYGVHFLFQNGVCGTPVPGVYVEHTKSPRYKYPNLKGTWNVCVGGEKQFHDEFCDGRKTCLLLDFEQENVTVVDLAVELKNSEMQISWTFPESWKKNCGKFIFKLWLSVEGILQQEKTLDPKLCLWGLCFSSFKNLKPGLNSVEVTPVFDNSILGSTSKESVTILKCPEAVTKINLKQENEKLLIKWYDNNYDIKELSYNVSIEDRELCKVPKRTISSSVMNKKEFTFSENENISFGYIIKVEPWVEGCPPSTIIRSTTFKNDKKVSLLLENLNASLTEESVKITWKIPSQWKHSCVIKHFQILIFKYITMKYSDENVLLSQSQICDDLICTYVWDGHLKPNTQYTFVVYAVFTNNVNSNVSSVSIVTPEDYPEIPENVVTKTVDGKKVLIRYNFKGYLDSLFNMSCQISFQDVNSRDNKTFNCSGGEGKFENEDFKKGMHYNVDVKICNSRSCREARVLDFGTHPEKPVFKEPFSYSPSGNNKITLTFPSYDDQQEGKIYIVVVKGNSSTLSTSSIEDFVEERYPSSKEVPTRRRRSIEDDRPFDISVVDVVDIKTKEYELNAEKVFKENETKSSISVAAVFAPEAGELRSLGSTPIIGPIVFPNGEEPGGTSTGFIWLIICLVVLICASIGLSIYLRRTSGMSLTSILKIKIPQDEDGSPGQHTLSPPKENVDPPPNSMMRQHLNRPSITESELAIFASKVDLSKSLQETPLNASMFDGESPSESDSYANIGPKMSYIEELEFYLLQASYSTSLEREFKSIPTTAQGKTFQEGVRFENRLKNRYQNNIPYDDTRVVLPLLDNIANSDYINANIVQLTTGKSGEYATYIPTQGPLKRGGVISDFWRMVWHQNVSAIVMLTNLIENGKAKCDQYWPDEGDECEYKEGIIVTTLSEEIRNSFVIRTLNISKDEEVREVIHYHYTEWPDHGVPVEASPLASMMNLVRSYHPYGPTVVHCSAGIGRTGCFILVIMCLEEYQTYNAVDLKRSLLFLRKCRSKLVQNFAQYQFSHYLLWVILFESTTTYPTSEFPFKWRNGIQNLEQENPNDPQALSKQFQKLKTFQNELTYFVAMEKDIRYKFNRYKSILPADSKRVFLLSVEGLPQDLYINAVMVDGFSKKDAYIVTEYPMESTICRVWYMILERQIPVWVLLNDMNEVFNETYPPIVPDSDTPFEFGDLTVSLLSSTSHEYFIENWIKIEGNSQETKTLNFECRIIQLLGWSPSSIAPETGPDQLFSMLDYIYSGGPYSSPLLFTCEDGATACGAALTLDISRQRSQSFDEVNIFSSCFRLINCRSEFIVSFEQYRLLHDYIASHILLSEQEIYENIQPT